MSLTLRIPKGSKLTFEEMDGNFTHLESLTQDKLDINSFNTFTSSYATGSFTGSFQGDGSGLTNLPGVTPIDTGSFATTGSNQFNGDQSISGSVIINGSISQIGIGDNNTVIGTETFLSNTSGEANTAVGTFNLQSNTTGTGNTVLGVGNLSGNTSGNSNVAIGFIAMGTENSGTGNNNVAIGESSLYSNTTGNSNIAIGLSALGSNTTGFENIAVGDNALTSVFGAQRNIAIGKGALSSLEQNQASGNTAIGFEAGRLQANGQSLSTAASSVFIGTNTRAEGLAQSNQIVIGNNAVGNGSNTVTIGDNNITSTHLKGIVHASTFSGSFVGDGSGLTGIPGVTPVDTGSFATTGSNVFVASQIISGSLDVSGSVLSNSYNLEVSDTTSVPVLNSDFNPILSGTATTFINKTLVLNDGKILIAGRFQSVDGHTTDDIARLNSDGTIDETFVATSIGGGVFAESHWINTFVVQPDGKIIIVGNFTSVSGSTRTGVARLNTDGTLDTSFTPPSLSTFFEVRDIALQSDGKSIIVGKFVDGIRRLNTDGTEDTSLSAITSSGFGFDTFFSVATQLDGVDEKILVGGSFNQWNTLAVYRKLVRLNPNGSLDTTFSGTNLAISTTSTDRIDRIKVSGDGNIWVGGIFTDTLFNIHGGFARITTEDEGDGIGAFGSEFRTYISGSVVFDFDFYDNDKIVLGGTFTQAGVFGNQQSTNRFIIVNRNNGGPVTGFLGSNYNFNNSVRTITVIPSTDDVLAGGTFTTVNLQSIESIASVKLQGFGTTVSTSSYKIDANLEKLTVSSSHTEFTGDVTVQGTVHAPTFSGSFQGDGSGLTGIPGVTPIDTASFATTGSNVFAGTQTVTQGSVNVQGSGSYKEFITQMNSPAAVQSIRGRGTGLYNITHPGDGTIVFTVSRITLNDLTGAITSNLSGANNGLYSDVEPETDGRGRGARLQLIVSDGTVTSVKIATFNANPDFEEFDQPANRQGIGYRVGDTLSLAAGTGGIGGTGNLVITLRPQDIDTYIGHSPNLTFDYRKNSGYRDLSVPGFIRPMGGLIFGQDVEVPGSGFSIIAGGQDVNMSEAHSIGVGFGLSSAHQVTSVFGGWNTTGAAGQTIVGIASITVEDFGAFVVGNGSGPSDKSNLMVAAGSTVQITGSLDISESTAILTTVSASLDFVDDAAAQAGGVPLGGLYRNGNDIKIRLV